MRITGLSIDGFGVFHDVEVPDLSPGLSLFVGDNEAGKSTTLAFVHTVLFGYPDGRTKENAYPPLAGGQAGGRLLVESDTAGALTLERRDGKKGGPLTVTFPDGHTEGEAALSRLLGGVTRSLYRKLYAFSLYELEQLNSLSDESVRDVIYGASLGTTSLSLPEVRARLETRKGDLFKPGGSKPQINALLKELEAVRGHLREARHGTGEYETLSSELADLETRIDAARDELHASREEHERLKAHLQLWDDWTALQDGEARLAALPEAVEDFPEEGLARLEELTAKIETETEALREVEEDLKEKGDGLQRLTFDERVLEREAEIRSLVRGLGTHEQSVAELPGARERLKSLERQAGEVLAEFGAGRTEEWVRAMDRSSTARSAVEAQAEALQAAHRRVERAADAETEAREERDHLETDADEAAKRVEELERALGDAAPAETVTALRERRAEFQGALRDLPRVEQQRAQAAANLAAALRDISPQWTADALETFDASLTARQKVTDSDARLTEATARVRETESALARARAGLDETEAQVRRQTEEVGAEAAEAAAAGGASMGALAEQKGWIRSLREALFQRQVAQAAVAAPADGGPSLVPRLQALAALVAAVAAVAALGLWLNAQPVVGLAAGGVLLFLAVALYTTARSMARPALPGPPGAGEAPGRGAELESATATIEDLKRKLALSGEVTAARVDELEDEHAARTGKAEDLARMRRALEDLEATRDRRAEARDAVATAAEAARAQRAAEEEAWQAFVETLRLPAGTSPRTAGEVFAKAETARGLARQMAEYDGRLADMRGARDTYLDLMRAVPALAAAVPTKDHEELLVALAQFLTEAARQEEQRRELAEARKAADGVAEELAAARTRLERAAAEHEQAWAAEEAGRSAWRAWLGERGMDEAWSPETTLRLLERAGRLAELAATRDEVAETAERLATEQEAFAARVKVLCAGLDRPEPPPDKRVAEVHALDAQLSEHQELRTRHQALADEIPDLETRRVSRRARLEELGAEVQELVAKGEATDEEAFRSRGRLYEQRQTLLESIAEHGERVKKGAGAIDLTELRDELEEKTLPALTVAEQEARERVGELETGLAELQQERARCDERRRQLLDEDDIARLRAEEESLLERFRELSTDWARHATALHLLSAAKDRFEQSHQPEVIHRAGEYFRKITDGRYKQVFAPHGEQTIEVIDERDRRVAVESLSRGTSEQLYLAIRFGYIASQDAGGERLPLLMDDVMVNFDPTRSLQAAQGILEMGETHQVLFFTCHPEVVAVFRGCEERVPVYELRGGGFGVWGEG